MICPTFDSLSNRSPSSIETVTVLSSASLPATLPLITHGKSALDSPSSMIHTFVLAHLCAAFLFFLTFLASSSAVSTPNPIPAKLWIVLPPILHAAIPVEAVTATTSA